MKNLVIIVTSVVTVNSEAELVDRTVDAQKVLSCVYRMKRQFGANMIVDVLRGSSNKKLFQ